jgi:glycosyltransferase involved in cell wall biosynthesis
MEGDDLMMATAAALRPIREASAAPAFRVLYVVSLFPCWSETFIVREIQGLMERGADVRIVSLRHPSEALVQSDARALLDWVSYPPRGLSAAAAALRELARAPGLQLGIVAALAARLAGRPKTLLKSLVAWWRTLSLAPRVRDLAPDWIHAHWATYPSTAALVLSRGLGVPFSFTAHAHDIFVEDHLLKEKLAAARFTVTISEFNKALLARRYGPESVDRVRVVHCGVRPEELPWSPGGDPGARRLLAVGRLDAIKGFAVLIDACGQLRDAGVPFSCEIVGEGELRAPLEERVRRLGLDERVRLSGALPQEEVRARLYGASVFVMPSMVAPDGNMDGIPVALMEAMAAGVPVVSTTVSGIPEIVTDGSSGRLVPPGDDRALAQAIRGLLEDPVAGRRLATAARQTVEAHFDAAREASRLHDFVSQALPQAASRRSK